MKLFTTVSAIVFITLSCATAKAAEAPVQVGLELHYVQFAAKDIQAIARKGSVGFEDLQELRKQGKSDLLFAPLRMITPSGAEATVKAVTEHIYPTDFSVARIIDIATTNELTSIRDKGTIVSTGVCPSGFQTREVGALFSALPEIAPDGKTIHITLTPEAVYETTPKEFVGKHVDSNGKEAEVELQQPAFRTFQVSTTVTLSDGATTFFGAMDSVTEDKVLYMFLTARIIGTDGKPIRKK